MLLQDNVERIVEELKAKNLIGKDIIIKKSPSVLNFKASIFERGLIKYNPNFSNMSEDTLKFIILHEVAHKQEKILKREIMGVLLSLLFAIPSVPVSYLIIGLSSLFNSLIYTGLAQVFALILPIYVFILTFRLLSPWIAQDEFDADIWAMKQLLKAYKIKDIEDYISGVFNEIASFSQKSKARKSWLGRLQGFFSLLFTYHPNFEDRILNIVSFFSEKEDRGKRI
ncbi:MAG: M48 family metalloprotease [Thermoplasmata archaeon]|nr:M48 family metalloprotease [Thermoplasmata archaeon]